MNEFNWPVRVYYEDTDAGGVVFYANYLKFMERARTEWLRSLGFDQALLAEQDEVVFAVRRAEVDFIRPARLDDKLTVNTRIAEMRKASMIFDQQIQLDSDNSVLSKGLIKVACVNAQSFRPQSIPERLILEMSDGE